MPDTPQLSLFNFHQFNSINAKLPYTDQFRFLDKAAIITSDEKLNANGSPVDPWRLCGMQHVEEVKCVIRVVPIWSAGIIYYVAIVQQSTYAVYQALQSDRRFSSAKFQIPTASYIMFMMLSLTFWIPLYDRILVPFLRKLTGKEGGITLLQRMGFGIFLSIVTTLVSGLVEEQRRHLALTQPILGLADRGGGIATMSVFWLVPQLALEGMTKLFESIRQIEFYYKQFPENIVSIAGSFFFLGIAGANYLSGFMVRMTHRSTNWLPNDLNKGRLYYFYYMIGALGVVNFAYFLVCAMWYRYKGTAGGATIEMSIESEQARKHIV